MYDPARSRIHDRRGGVRGDGLLRAACAMAICLAGFNSALALADPSAGTLSISGAPSFTPPPPGPALVSSANVHTVVNWSSFSIQPSAAARFMQPSNSTAALNRISNQVISNLHAPTLGPSSIGLPIISGTRSQREIAPARDGGVSLSGGEQDLDGVTSENGKIMLAPGKSVTIGDPATPGVSIEVKAGQTAADLGQVLAQSDKLGLVGALVRNSGRVNADHVVRGADGKIHLRAQ